MTTTTLEMSWLTISDTDAALDPSSVSDTHTAELWTADADEEADAIWEARRGRRQAVRRVGYACIAALGALVAGLAGAPAARGEMAAWGTMGRVTMPHAAITAITAPRSNAGASMVAAAPKAEAPAAPAAPTAAAVEPPAPAAVEPAAAAPAAIAAAAPASVAAHVAPHRGGRYLDDPYADRRVAAAPPRRAHEYLADPY